MKILDNLNVSLSGLNFIEASAGTGKTFTLEGLYIRLLLEKEFTPDQILVVTFTRAATEELKDRIRKKLILLKEALLSESCEDPFIERLVKKIEKFKKAAEITQTALADFDRAAIFTIHGFCQRILNENAFETDNLFDSEVLTDPSILFDQIARDFWRIHFYQAPLELVVHGLENKISGPTFFASLLQRYRLPNLHIIPEKISKPDLDEGLKAYRALFTELKHNWNQSKIDVMTLLKAPSLNGTRYGTLKPIYKGSNISRREVRINEVAFEMDQYASKNSMGYPLFKKFDLFRQSEIFRSTKKGQTPPQHPFFELCDNFFSQYGRLERQLDRYLLYVKSEFKKFAVDKLLEEKNKSNLIRFDDLLLMVEKALNGDGGDQLAAKIRQKYRAVLVDEFQDTDKIQFDIFSRLFSHKDMPLFLIGDPKQAIYGFRGADIYSYMDAVHKAGDPYTLMTNYRSDPHLIHAVNTIFSNRQHPFLFKDIKFKSAQPNDIETKNNPTGSAPMVLWQLLSTSDKPFSRTEATRLILEATANEILRLNNSLNMENGFGDIAVIVRTNQQAKIVQEKLSEKKIPSVIYESGNIFDTHEALELYRLLQAIVFPNDRRRLRAALATDLLGSNGNSDDFKEASSAWEMRLSSFKTYASMLKAHGFMRMFRQLMATQHVKKRLMLNVDGERRLTNIMHLIELLHQAAIEENLDGIGLMKWLNEKRQLKEGEPELHLLRLESDENAVKILTIHKCKGLEFPIVFCPFAWDSFGHLGEGVEFHDPRHQNRLTLDLGSDHKEKNTVNALNEKLAENLRLLYVALTRAKTKCYMAWGGIKNTETSAPAYLFHYDGDDPEDVTGALKQFMTKKSNDDLLADLYRMANSSGNAVAVVQLPVEDINLNMNGKKSEQQLCLKRCASSIPKDFKISSYSSLIATGPQTHDFFDQLDITDKQLIIRHDLALNDVPKAEKQVFSNIMNFPRGTGAGLFFHEVFEQIDFSENDGQQRETIVGDKLLQYGFEPQWQSAVCKMIKNVLSTKLEKIKADFSLSRLSTTDRINEMEFYFPVDDMAPKTMAALFHYHASAHVPMDYHHYLGKLKFLPFSGYVKGFVDLIFHFDKRYYIVDWKSNFLGPTFEHYHKSFLTDVMIEHQYFLQYHLYALALHRYLKVRVPSYCYENNFGGVVYLFIRAMDPEKGDEYGVYFDKPKKIMIEKLELLLFPNKKNLSVT